MDIHIGTVTHFYRKIGVAVVEVVNQPIKTGDMIRISGHDSDFTQTISSIQKEHVSIEEAQPGETIGVQMTNTVKPGDRLYLVSSV